MPNLNLIDKYAFKGLQKLRLNFFLIPKKNVFIFRLIQIISNPKLQELYKATFSGIGNENAIRIIIKNNSLYRIRAMTFK